MSFLARRCSLLVRLLTVLWAVGRSGARQPQPSAYAGAGLSAAQLARQAVVDITTSHIQPMIDKLSASIDGLDSRLNGIESRLNVLDLKQHRFDVRLDDLTPRVDSADNRFDYRLDELVSRVDSTEGRLDSRLNELVSRANSTERRLDSRLDEMVSRMDGLAAGQSDRLDSASSLLDGLSSRLDGLSSRLDGLANQTDRGQSDRADPRIQTLLPNDCSDLPARAQSGIHLLQPGPDCSRPPVRAYCDLDTDGGGWTVIQRRADLEPRQDFNLDWSAYREGFGELNAEFWWGLENLRRMTGLPDRQYELRVNLADFDGERRYAAYRQFRVASGADGYRLSIANYTGNAGDGLGKHNGLKFSTKDRDQDILDQRHCAQVYKGGWWFSDCYYSHLNGQYLSGKQENIGGINWFDWRGVRYSLKKSEMKIRPVNTY